MVDTYHYHSEYKELDLEMFTEEQLMALYDLLDITVEKPSDCMGITIRSYDVDVKAGTMKGE